VAASSDMLETPHPESQPDTLRDAPRRIDALADDYIGKLRARNISSPKMYCLVSCNRKHIRSTAIFFFMIGTYMIGTVANCVRESDSPSLTTGCCSCFYRFDGFDLNYGDSELFE
jgi:hypothetical protein